MLLYKQLQLRNSLEGFGVFRALLTSALPDFQRLSCRVQVGMDELRGRGGGEEERVGIKELRGCIISCSPCLKRKYTVIKGGVCKKGTCIRENFGGFEGECDWAVRELILPLQKVLCKVFICQEFCI